MKINAIRAYRRDIPLTNPYTIAFQTTEVAELAFVEIELANGTVGFGASAASEHVIGESIEDSIRNLQSDTVQQWVGRDIRHFRQLISEVKQAFPQHSGTVTCLDIGLHDAFGKYLDVPILEFYGQKVKPLPTSVTIGIKSVEETLEDAKSYQQQGFKVLKIKTGLELEQDIERCTKVREHFGDSLHLRVDANQGYSSNQTIAFHKATQKLKLELIEQPMPIGTEVEMKTLPEELKVKIACDESLKNTASALELIDGAGACGIFNIKLMKCGGLLGAFEIANIAQNAGVELFWGCFDESIVSITAALHAALACPATRYIDLDGSLDLAEDLFRGGFELNDGILYPNHLSGFGIELI
ncbi:MAG TPA: dipeptide epimerase [Saprospiraceae bacterium]|nr:dipeptide epimerase [Saprospiraceae bacterium]